MISIILIIYLLINFFCLGYWYNDYTHFGRPYEYPAWFEITVIILGGLFIVLIENIQQLYVSYKIYKKRKRQ